MSASKAGVTAPTSPPAKVAPPSRLLRGRASRWIATILIVALLVIFFSVANDDWFTIVNYTVIAAIAALSLNVLSGYTGQISLGIAFFMAIGAYAAAFFGGDMPQSSRPGAAVHYLVACCRYRGCSCGGTHRANSAETERFLPGHRDAFVDLHRTVSLFECARHYRRAAGAYIPGTCSGQQYI
jgi:hypothetical protein